MKCGQYIQLNGIRYMFLGYSDYKRRWGVIADIHGNTHLSQF
jgi:hypothetical protein